MTLAIPTETLHALRAAVLDAPDGERRLRDAGSVAGRAMFDDFAAFVHTSDAVEPDALPLPRFAALLAEYFAECGYGTTEVSMREGDDVVRISSSDWVEAEPDAHATYPSCHFSTGLLAGFFGRVAHEPLAVLETSCRCAGAPRCCFAIGSRAVMDALWEGLREGRNG